MEVTDIVERLREYADADMAGERVNAANRRAAEWDAITEIKTLRAELAKYTFKCPEYIWGGPGHQSKHQCDYNWPHPQIGEHGERGYCEWEVTEIDKDKEHFT